MHRFYLRKMVADYLSHRILKYDTEIDPKEYEITGDVLQGSVLGLLLWNIMYDGLLGLTLPEEAELIAYVDDVAIVVVAKYLQEIMRISNKTIAIIEN